LKRITYWALSTISALVLLFGYRTSTSSSMAGGTTTPIAGSAGLTDAGSTPAASSSSSVSDSSNSGSSSSSSPQSGGSTATFTGDAAGTRWGPVQVQITVTDGKITAVTVPEYPTSNREDQQINSRALPVLIKETISAQSADIDMVSGATVTSQGYIRSLQSALDEAGL
jgi:uncharacterized protein with FMN-binding domain